jgi:hypothetical protein
MMPDEHHKKRALPDQLRESALDSAAATLAAIHMAKQVGAEVRAGGGGAGTSGRVPADLRLPLGDVLFGVAQLQVDFAKRLFEFNQSVSRKLRDRIREAAPRPPRPTMRATGKDNAPSEPLSFHLENGASRSRTLEIGTHAPKGWRVEFRCDGDKDWTATPPRLTVRAGQVSPTIRARFLSLPLGTHGGGFIVRSQGIQVDYLPFEIAVT